MAQIVKLRRSSVSGQKPTNTNLQLGELALNTTDGKIFLAKSGSLGPSVEEVIVTNTVNTGSVNISGSFNLTGNGIITGSLTALGSQSNSKSIIVDSTWNYQTSWAMRNGIYSTEFNLGGSTKSVNEGGPGSLQISTYNSSTNTFRYPVTYFQNANVAFGGLSTTVPTDNGSTLQVNGTTSVSSLSGIGTRMVVADEDGVLGVQEISTSGDSEGRTAIHTQTIASTGWTFNHNLGEKYPAITVFDSGGNVIIPSNITAVNTNTLTVSFSSPVSGVISATVGGGLPSISASYNGRVLSIENDTPVWKTGIVSGSSQISFSGLTGTPSGLISGSSQVSYSGITGIPSNIISGSSQISNLGFAITGSNTFTGNQTINGDLTISESLIKQVTATGLTTNTSISILPTASYNAGFFDYVIKNGSNLRAGNIMSVWDGSTVNFTETTTNDIGNTSGVTLSVAESNGNISLTTQISSGTWTIKVLSRGI